MQQMTLPADAKLTPEVTRELCLRSSSKAYIAGSIDSMGSEYVLGLKAVNCETEETLADEQVTAASKENVLAALGEMCIRDRRAGFTGRPGCTRTRWQSVRIFAHWRHQQKMHSGERLRHHLRNKYRPGQHPHRDLELRFPR